jgi:PEP-CTERM motif
MSHKLFPTSRFHSAKRIAAASLTGLLCAPGAFAAVGDTLTYKFNAPSVGGAVAGVNQATLLLTETAVGVNFRLTPDWAATTGNRVDQLQFAYMTGTTFSYVDGAGPDASFATSIGAIDSGYNTTALVTMQWPSANNSPNYFDAADVSSSWSLNGVGVDLFDFTVLATATSTKPSPGFGVISMPGAAPSNWVASSATITTAVPEPETYALMMVGLGLMGCVARRRKKA